MPVHPRPIVGAEPRRQRRRQRGDVAVGHQGGGLAGARYEAAGGGAVQQAGHDNLNGLPAGRVDGGGKGFGGAWYEAAVGGAGHRRGMTIWTGSLGVWVGGGG